MMLVLFFCVSVSFVGELRETDCHPHTCIISLYIILLSLYIILLSLYYYIIYDLFLSLNVYSNLMSLLINMKQVK